MANFSPTNLVKAQALLQKKFSAPESRMKPSPVIMLGMGNSDLLIPGHQELRKRDDRAVEANILKRSKRATTSSRTHNHSGNRGDSFVLALSWATFADKFSISLKQLNNNVFSFEAALAQQIENTMMNIVESIETYIVTLLQSERTQINIATAEGSFNATNYAYEITKAAQFYQIIQSMMRKNNYKGAYDVITNSNAFINAQYLAAQGSQNAINTSFQLQNLNIAESNDLVDSNYASTDVALVMPQGSFGILPWIPKENRQGWGDYNSTVGGYGMMKDPFGLGLEFAVHGLAAAADTSASNGDTQDVVLNFELSVDIAAPISPLSVATETTVFEAALV
jgi:hypothetical protein